MKKYINSAILIAALFLLASPCWCEIVAREGKGYLEKVDGQLILHIKGTPYEMGFQHGKLLKEKVKQTTTNINNNQTEKGKTTEYMMYKMLRGGMHTRLKPHIPARFFEEMRGIADGAEVKVEDVFAANLFPEAFHCSGIALMGKATHDGSLYHVRILDFMTDVGFQDTAVHVIAEPDGGHAFMNVGFAGFLGSVTGMNEKQITIGEMGGGGQGHWDGMPMSFLIRDALERASTLQEAMDIFANTPRTCEFFYVISDAKIPDARGVYATPKQIHFVKPGESYAMFDMPAAPPGDSGGNRFITKGFELVSSPVQTLMKSAKGKTIGMFNIQPEDSVIFSGDDRYKFFADRLVEKYGQVDEILLQEMITRPVSMKDNLHNVIFHPSTLEAWVAWADEDGNPSCNQPYHHIRLTRQQVETTMAK